MSSAHVVTIACGALCLAFAAFYLANWWKMCQYPNDGEPWWRPFVNPGAMNPKHYTSAGRVYLSRAAYSAILTVISLFLTSMMYVRYWGQR